jgi:hypothetical protein
VNEAAVYLLDLEGGGGIQAAAYLLDLEAAGSSVAVAAE